MQAYKDIPAGSITPVTVTEEPDGSQVVKDAQGDLLLRFTQMINAPDPTPHHSVAPYVSPTKKNKEESKKRRKMARASRKKNRR